MKFEQLLQSLLSLPFSLIKELGFRKAGWKTLINNLMFFCEQGEQNQIFGQYKLILFIFPCFLGLGARLTCFCMCTYLQDPAIFAPQNNPPCPTLFVANLGQTVSDRELTDVFSRYGLIKAL